MLTLLVLFCLLLILAFICAVIWGIIAVSPILVAIIVLILVDYFVLKTILGKKK